MSTGARAAAYEPLSCVFSFSGDLTPLDHLLLGSAMLLPPSVIGRRAGFQLLADRATARIKVYRFYPPKAGGL